MIGLLLGVGLTVVSASSESPSPPSWSCAYAAERLPRSLAERGEDTASAEETRTARRKLGLADAVLTRASHLALARSLGASRLITLRCLDRGGATTFEAQSFDTEKPGAGPQVRVLRPTDQLASAVEELAVSLKPRHPEALSAESLRSAQALQTAGPALALANPAERAAGLERALARTPSSLDLRLSAVEAFSALRDFDRALRLASTPPGEGSAVLNRALRFQAGVAQLEAGRYAEARSSFEALAAVKETAAVLNNLGVALFRLREKNAARPFERASFLTDHRQQDVAFNRSLALLFDGQPESALPFIDDIRVATPDDARARLLKVWALRLLGRENERAREWERLLAIAPSFAGLGVPDLARRLERIFLSERSPSP